MAGRKCNLSQQHVLSPLGGEFRDMLAKGTASGRGLLGGPWQGLASKQLRQPGQHRVEEWGWGTRWGGNSIPCSHWLSESMAATPQSSYLLELQPQALHSPLF